MLANDDIETAVPIHVCEAGSFLVAGHRVAKKSRHFPAADLTVAPALVHIEIPEAEEIDVAVAVDVSDVASFRKDFLR